MLSSQNFPFSANGAAIRCKGAIVILSLLLFQLSGQAALNKWENLAAGAVFTLRGRQSRSGGLQLLLYLTTLSPRHNLAARVAIGWLLSWLALTAQRPLLRYRGCFRTIAFGFDVLELRQSFDLFRVKQRCLLARLLEPLTDSLWYENGLVWAFWLIQAKSVAVWWFSLLAYHLSDGFADAYPFLDRLFRATSLWLIGLGNAV